MTFINMAEVEITRPLKSIHYNFPRAAALQEAFSACVVDYYIKAGTGRSFEARGLVITGQSRLGKTQEIERLLARFNASKTLMPNGKPARVVSCLLSAKDSWKELGVKTLHALGYPLQSRRPQAYIWNLVREQAEEQGVVGIAYDECQHVFSKEEGASNDIFRDSLKTLLKDPRRPMMLFLSGIPALAGQLSTGGAGQQLAALLTPVEFDAIVLPRDMEELNRLAYSFADKAGVDFEPLSDPDFYQRLSHACAGRWGLVIEILIAALVRCRLAGSREISIEHFVEAYAKRASLSLGFSPFTIPDYQDVFNSEKLLSLVEEIDKAA